MFALTVCFISMNVIRVYLTLPTYTFAFVLYYYRLIGIIKVDRHSRRLATEIKLKEIENNFTVILNKIRTFLSSSLLL